MEKVKYSEKVRHYFPGGNTPQGFVSFYDNILRTTSTGKLGVIKGGPGTGKSGLMKRLGAYFENMGEYVHYLHCSSDCESLDGVYLPKYNSAVIDGTSPHVVDCRYPGAYDKIFDVGVLIKDGISEYKEEIKAVNSEIKKHFSGAYEYLNVARAIGDIAERKSADTLDFGEVNNFAYNIAKRAVNEKDSGKIRKMFLSGITPQGLKNYVDTVFGDKYVIKLECDIGDSGYKILKKIISYCKNQNTDMDIYYCPLKPDKPEHIVFVNSHLAVSIANKYHSVKNSDEVVYYKDFVKNDYNNTDEIHDYEAYIEKAVGEIGNAKRLHDKLEEYYIKNFEFEKLDAFYEDMKKFMSN